MEWLMLPKRILAVPTTKQKNGSNQTAALIRRRAERWLAGERLTLWQEAVQACTVHRTRNKKGPNKANRHQRAIKL
eukprot:2514363-Karenia_brevis.AAC.1